MTRLKTVGSMISILIFVFMLPSSHEQYRNYDWPSMHEPKWDKFNSLFAFESSRIIPPVETGNGISQNPGFARQYFNFGPKPGVVVTPPNSGVPFILEIPRQRPLNNPVVREINVTEERMGGYGGYGDVRGYGAYEYKHDVETNDFPMPIADILRATSKRSKKPFLDTFFNLLPMEDV